MTGVIFIILHCALFRSCHPERAILLRVERGARHEVSGSRIKSCYLLVDPVLRTPLRGSTSLRSAQDDTRSLFERTMCAKTSLQESFLIQLCQMFMPSGAKRQNLILQSASLAVGTADLFFKKGNENT